MRFLKAAVLMAVLLTCAVLMLGVLSLRGHPVRGGGGGAVPTTTVNGDINCDGKRDISDAIGLLSYLFLNGTEPCALSQEPDLSTLAQKLDEIKQAIEAQGGSCRKPDQRFVDNGDGTVTDTCTNLMWQSNFTSFDIDLDGRLDSGFNLNQAKTVPAQSKVGGHQDWRIPTYQEFEGLIYYIAAKPYKLNWLPPFELNIGDTGATYWSSSPGPGGEEFTAVLNPSQKEFGITLTGQEQLCRLLLVRP